MAAFHPWRVGKSRALTDSWLTLGFAIGFMNEKDYNGYGSFRNDPLH